MGLENWGHGDVVVVGISGECLDAAAVASLRECLLEALKRGDPVVLDMSGVAFADTSGLGLVRGLVAKNSALACVGPSLAASLSRIPWRMRPPEYETVEDAALALSRSATTSPGTSRLDLDFAGHPQPSMA